LPTVTVTNKAICSGASTTITASGAIAYTWYTTSLQTTSTISVAPTITTNYIVTGTDNNGCTNTANATVTVNPKPNVVVNSPTITKGSIATLCASGALTYKWSVFVATSNNCITISTTTNKTYRVTGTDANGCMNSDTAYVTVIDNINEYNSIGNVLIYPNPNTGQFTVQITTANNEIVNLKIINLLGITVFEQRNIAVVGNYSKQIDLGKISNGV